MGAATGSVTGRCCKSGRAAYTARQRGTCECADHALVANPVAEMQVDTLLQSAREKVQNCARAAPFCPTQGGPSNWPAFLHLDPFLPIYTALVPEASPFPLQEPIDTLLPFACESLPSQPRAPACRDLRETSFYDVLSNSVHFVPRALHHPKRRNLNLNG